VRDALDMTVDHRMESFVTVFGDVPPEAHRLDDSEARHHGATWIRRLLGKGIACQYVIAYQHRERWWTFCFEREPDPAVETEADELWTIEAYDSTGRSWCDIFRFDPLASIWQRAAETMRRLAPRLGHIPA
jgi:hypothetical protein